jgi:hypothetical protein
LAAITAVACGDDPAAVDPAAEAAAVGTYTLIAVGTSPLPFQYGLSDTSRFEIIAGNIVLEADHDVTRETVTTETRLSNGTPIGAEAVQRHLGTWSLRGADSVRLVFPGLETRMAALNPTTLTVASVINSLTYTR